MKWQDQLGTKFLQDWNNLPSLTIRFFWGEEVEIAFLVGLQSSG